MLVGTSPLIEVRPGLMIWTILCFLIALYVLKRFAFGPIQKTIDERRERIHQALAEADKNREDSKQLLQKHEALLDRARVDAEEILSEARRISESQRERVKEEIEQDRQRRLEDTRRQIEAETRRALEQIRQEVASLAMVAASKVARRSLDDAQHRKLIDEAIAELDFSALEGSQN